MNRASTRFLVVAISTLLVACAFGMNYRHVDMRPRTPYPGLFIEEVKDNVDPVVPLKGVKASVVMIDSMAKVTLVQTYENPLKQPIKVNYIFPLDEKAAITEFTATYSDGRKLIGVSKEREAAKQEFEEGVAAGQSSVLLEQQASDVFQAHIGNLEKGQEVVVTITYLTTVPLESSDEYRFTLPTLVAPRYGGGAAQPPVKDSAAEKYKMQFELSAIMSSEVKKIESPTHKLQVTPSASQGGQMKASVTGDVNGDFVVILKLKDGRKKESVAILEKDAKFREHSALFLNLDAAEYLKAQTTKESSAEDSKTELWFVVDVSGSMNGYKMEDTISAMKSAVTQLHESKRKIKFNIVPFSSSFSSLFEKPTLMDDEALKKAINFIETFTPNGGTELRPALEHVLKHTCKGRRRVIVLTDGLVSDNKEIFDLAKKNVEHTQMFSIGIGDGVSHSLVNGIAQHGAGVSEYVANGESVTSKVHRQLSRALSHTTTRVTITYLDKTGATVAVSSGNEKISKISGTTTSQSDASSQTVLQTPLELPPIYSESDVRVFALLPESVTKIKIAVPGVPARIIDLSTVKTVPGSDIIHKMAAKAHIRDLEVALADADSVGRLTEEDAEGPITRTTSNMKSEIIRLATKYNLMSSLTSFVAVDPNPKPKKDGEDDTERQVVSISVPTHSERGTHTFAKTRFHMAAMPRDVAFGRTDEVPLVLNFEEIAKSHDEVGPNRVPENTAEEPIDIADDGTDLSSSHPGASQPVKPFKHLLPDEDDFFLADILYTFFSWIQKLLDSFYSELLH